MNIGLLLDPYGEKSPGGLGRCIFEIAKALLTLDTTNNYVVYVKNAPAQPPELSGNRWRLVALESRWLWLTGARRMDKTLDAYIFFTPVVPLFFRPKRSVVVALDFAYLAFAESFSEKLAAWVLYFIHWRSLRMADEVVAISMQTKEEVIRLFGISPGRITVVHLAGIDFDPNLKALPVPEHFFLFAGVLKPRKNVAGVIRAFAEFAASDSEDYRLLIDGKKSGSYYDSLVRLTTQLGVADKVTFLGYVTDEELAFLYTKARALVFPSFIEGFGMPVLEAMRAGLPVITSNRGALMEVAGNAALLVNPDDPQDIARGMRELASQPGLRDELIRKGSARACEFSWEKTASKFLEIVATLV